MKKGDLFKWLVEYHCTTNLQHCHRYIKNGVIVDLHGKPYLPGQDQENEYYPGMLFAANGPDLAKNLKRDLIILDPKLPTFYRTSSKSELYDYLKDRSGKDGAHVCNTLDEETGRIVTFNNTPTTLPEDFEFMTLFPPEMADNIGNKTLVAALIAHAFPNTDTYLIRRSPDGNLGIGPILHFGKDGVEDKVQLNLEPQHTGPFIDKKRKITARQIKYNRNQAGVIVPYSSDYIDGKSFDS